MNQKILVVDDEPDILKVVKTDLTDAGYEVLTAQTAAEGIAATKRLAPDLIVMDLMLPDMNGADAIKEIKQYPEFRKVPVLFLTAMVKPQEELKQDLKVNIHDEWYETIAKPFERADLLLKIKQKLGQ